MRGANTMRPIRVKARLLALFPAFPPLWAFICPYGRPTALCEIGSVMKRSSMLMIFCRTRARRPPRIPTWLARPGR